MTVNQIAVADVAEYVVHKELLAFDEYFLFDFFMIPFNQTLLDE